MNIYLKVVMIVAVLLVRIHLFGQNNEQFYASIFYSKQKVDDRLIGASEPLKELFEKYNSEMENIGTNHFGVQLGYNLFSNKKFLITSEIGWSKEATNFWRVFNQGALGETTDILILQNRYNYELINLNLNFKYKLLENKNFNIHTGLLLHSYFRYHSCYRNRSRKWNWDKKDFMSIELNPNVGIYFYKFSIDFYYRLFQLRKIDRAIFGKNDTGYGAIEKDYETFNPMKLGISIKYWFNLHKQKEKDGTKGKF